MVYFSFYFVIVIVYVYVDKEFMAIQRYYSYLGTLADGNIL